MAYLAPAMRLLMEGFAQKEKSYALCCFTEGLGTYFLVLAVVLTGNPFVIGAVLSVVIYLGYAISGAHYNPAVTLVIWWKNKMKAYEAIGYLSVQMAAGFLAALTALLLSGNIYAPLPATTVGPGKTVIIELLFTFVLVFIILLVAASKKTAGNRYYGLAIGATVVVISLLGGGLSGGAFNPAVGTGPVIVDGLANGTPHDHWWLYLAGPLCGGMLAGVAFWLVSPKDFC